jgi:prepilin-type N-terminal cleavage/methylation domain-containing protein
VRQRHGFTIVELLVSVSIIALLIGILLPAIGKARDQARLTTSQSNLRTIGQAESTYAAEWNGRQVTVVDDNLARYGDAPIPALQAFEQVNGYNHPSIWAGAIYQNYWGWPLGNPTIWGPIITAINFQDAWYGFGWFRIPNARPLNSYINGKYYDPVFFAPKEPIVWPIVQDCLEMPTEAGGCYQSSTSGPDGGGDLIYTSYVRSPAALFSPDVMRNPPGGGWQDPWRLDSGLRVPSLDAARYPDLKTQMLEHHWLQNARAECNSAFANGTYDGCEPYYFNHSWESVPVTLFYDGHVGALGVREAESADARMQTQSGYGLWSRDTPFGSEGYFIAEGYDFAATSFHILTTDGIRGRDKLSR